MPTTIPPLLQTLAQPHWLVPLALLLWLAASALLSRMAGFAALGREFAAAQAPQGQVIRFVSGSMGSVHWPVRYRHCLRLVVSPQGLYLALMFPFGFMSRPLWLPWHAVESLTEKQLLGTRSVSLRWRGHWPVLTLAGPMGQVAKEAHAHATAAPSAGA